MSLYDQVPCLDALLADIQKLNDTANYDDLNSALHEIFTGEKDGPETSRSRSRPSKKRPNRPIYRFICWFWIAFGIFTSCFILLPVFSSDVIDFMDYSLNMNVSHLRRLHDDYFVRYLKTVRKITIFSKVTEVFPVTDLDFDECIIENPLHTALVKEALDCENYQGMEPLYIDREDVHVITDKYDFDQPTVYKDKGKETNLKELPELIIKNSIQLNSDTTSISTNRQYINTVEDLAKDGVLERVQEDAGIHLVWTFLSYMSSYTLRNLFTHPHQILSKEVIRSFKSLILIDGQDSPLYKLELPIRGVSSQCMYTQASGSRRLIFSPIPACANKFSPLSVIMKPKDIVIFAKDMWVIHSEPFDDSRSLSFVNDFDVID